ncbi:MAG TPA: PA2169 family four-helix-bundle protein [Verrucomicrobiales bacterium]|nr:PA2169 family four-helix-bundle protein [Verrucomicrobiales bacterium]
MDAILMDYPAGRRSFDPAGNDTDRDVLAVLADTIEVLRDSEKGFRQASEHAASPELKDEFLNYSGQRALFVGELQDFERVYGRKNVDHAGSVSGAMHRAWVGLKTVLSGRSDKTILEEVAEGEKAAADFYAALLATQVNLPSQVSQCLSRQCAELQKGQIELRNQCANWPS